MDDVSNNTMNTSNPPDTKKKDERIPFTDKYTGKFKDVDIIKEIERLKMKIAKNLKNDTNSNINEIQKEPEKTIDIIQEKYDCNETPKVTKQTNDNLDDISKIALNIVNKVALKKENKTPNNNGDEFKQRNEEKENENKAAEEEEEKEEEDEKEENEEEEQEEEEDEEEEEEEPRPINKKVISNKKHEEDGSVDENEEDKDDNQSNISERSNQFKDEPIKISELRSENNINTIKDIKPMPIINKNGNIYNNSKQKSPDLLAESELNDLSKNNSNNRLERASPDKSEILRKNLKPKDKDSQLQSSSASNTFSVSQLNQKFQSQIKIIEKKSETNLLEHEQNLKDLKKIEEELQIDERITHENREIRKNACKEITEMCTEDFTEEEKTEFFECFSPWVKYYIEETPYVLPDALNFFIVFNSTFPEFKATSLNDFFDNLERITSFGISSLNDLCRKIIDMFIKDKKLFNQTFTELVKGLNKSSIRLSKFLSDVISDMIQKGVFSENYIKIIFEKSIHMYLSINTKNSEKKKVNGRLIALIYSILEDNFITIQKYIRVTSKKEFNTLLSKVQKSETRPKYRLYPEELEDVSQMESMGYNDKNQKVKIQDKTNRDCTPSTTANNQQQINISPEVNDLCLIIPSTFFEFNLLTQYAEKMNILEEVNRILTKVTDVKDKEKNYIEIYKSLNYCIEDSNILIHLEGIKVFGHIARLLQSQIHNQKVKSLLESCFEKFKDKKSLVKSELFNLFDLIIENSCITSDSFIVLVFQFCLNNQKKAVPIVKQGVMEYLKQFMKSSNPIIKNSLAVLNEKCYLSYAKYLIEIISVESQSNIKDLCTDLLLIFKSKTKNRDNVSQFNELTKNLPQYRKNILTNDKADYCISESNNNYKRNLKNIKSNISFTSKSISKDKRLNSSFRKDTLSTPKNNKMKTQKINQNTNIKHKSTNNVLKASKDLNSSQQIITNMKVIKKNTKELDNDNDNENETDVRSNQPKEKDIPLKKPKINKEGQQEEKKKKDILEKRKVDVVKHISSLNKKALEEYSKVIVRDFLFFVNKVSCGSLTDDLSNHFEVIINILGKILERMLLLNSNNEETDLTESVSNQISDDLINRIIKVVILLPCIDQVEGSSDFDMNLLHNFVASIKQASTSEEKFFIYLLINLIKFSNKGKGFLENINPKPSIVFFLDYITICKVRSEKIHSMINEFVDETELLSKEEKTRYITIKGVSPISSREVTQNIDDEEERELKRENNEISVQDNFDNPQDDKPTTMNEEEDFLSKKIKESEDLIRMKQEENEKLKLKIRQYEEKKIGIEQSGVIIPETTVNNQIISVTQPQVSQILPSGNMVNKLIEESKDRIINNLKSANSGDILKIKEQFNMTTKKLDLTLKRMVEKTGNKEKDVQEQILSQMKQISIKEFQKDYSTPIKQIRNLEDCFTEEQEQSYRQDNLSEIQQVVNQTPYSNSNSIQEIFKNQKESPLNYKKSIKQLVSFFEGNTHQLNLDDLFYQLEHTYRKLQTTDNKVDYIDYVRNHLCNSNLLERISINTYLQFYEYILNLLSSEILTTPGNDTTVMHLQSIAENLKNYRRLSEMIQMMLFLLRKYFPKNLNNKISDIALVILKVIAYLIKELIKSIPKIQVEPRDIIGEINELFTITPPDSLKSSTPNNKLYEHIFTVLKSLTDEVFYQNKNRFIEVIDYLNNNKITNKAYMKYLQNLCEIE